MSLEPCLIFDCRIAGATGDTTARGAIACTVAGSALLGPATFPSWRPETFPGERAVWRRGRWWIVQRKVRAR